MKDVLKTIYVNFIYPMVLVYVQQTKTKIDDEVLKMVDNIIRKALS